MYAIRNKHDPSIYFHLPKSGGRKQMTQIDHFEAGKVPRLFEQKRFASNVLSTWLAGKLINGINEHDGRSHTKLVPMPDRRKKDWEIVEVKVVEFYKYICDRNGI